ncbi:translin-associated protein X isoform X1 [Lepeophtheirus salmonis]|uniref:translin-associated protein X isoform X1 n=1 Tax=Lepeophtheirus salmonis TaxID=72036 RepID=UPI001AE3AA39|nr:translin-associated protein X-like isoform X1 [Lepeophtheirus salmonis]XP_040573469.1 translin-associated protein X-like isoform X1 [Lepeophtheirus salmonis]XP_040573470.1 translin-associated protein X-like isoform X1 [Lepeophtheirus salmonis]
MTSLASSTKSSETKESCSERKKEDTSSNTVANIQGIESSTASGDLTENTRDTWKCPDPGCKKVNIKSAKCCIQCQLPRNSAHQFKKGGKKEGRSHHHHHHHHSKTSGGGDGQNNSSSSVLPEDLANRPIVQMFYGLSNELDQRHDKYERIVKLCRDITIESKRIIFHLHRIQNVEEEMSTLLEVEERLKKIRSTHWIQVAKELEGESPFQFLRAYTGGLQEYIEAVSFYHFLRYNELVFREQVQSDLIFEREEVFNDNALDVSSKEELGTKRKPLLVTVPRTDFILGIADLTGEVMRRVINSIGFGDTETCFKLTNFLHDVYYGFKLFDGLTLENRELRSKSYTMLNSLKKCEAACYTINLRGSEIPKHMFAEILYKNERDEVESVKNTMDISGAYYDDD